MILSIAFQRALISLAHFLWISGPVRPAISAFVSRITYFNGREIFLIDGLPESTSRCRDNGNRNWEVVPVLAPTPQVCRRARGRQDRAFGGANGPVLTAAALAGARIERPGRENAPQGAELENRGRASFMPGFCNQDM